MRTIALLFLGVVIGWAASGVDWSREAVAQEAPRRGAERSIRRERDGALRRRLLPSREAEASAPAAEAPPYDPNSKIEPELNVTPGPSTGMEELAEPIVEPTHAAIASPGLPGRFQVSAYGWTNGHGCYVVDTVTGQTWHVANGQPAQVVTAGLTPHAPQPAAPAPAPLLSPPPVLREPNASNVVPQPSTDAAD
jgi:hypothetical protein